MKKVSYLAKNDPEAKESVGHSIDGNVVRCFGQYDCAFCGLESLIEETQRGVSGRLLTIMDGSIAEPRQNKAVKDMVSNEIHRTLYRGGNDYPGDLGVRERMRSLLLLAIRQEADAENS